MVGNRFVHAANDFCYVISQQSYTLVLYLWLNASSQKCHKLPLLFLCVWYITNVILAKICNVELHKTFRNSIQLGLMAFSFTTFVWCVLSYWSQILQSYMFTLTSLVCCDVPITSIKTGRGRRKAGRVLSSFLVSLRRHFGRVATDIFILSLRVTASCACLTPKIFQSHLLDVKWRGNTEPTLTQIQRQFS